MMSVVFFFKKKPETQRIEQKRKQKKEGKEGVAKICPQGKRDRTLSDQDSMALGFDCRKVSKSLLEKERVYKSR